MKIIFKKLILVTLIITQIFLFFSYAGGVSARVPVVDHRVGSYTKNIKEKTSWLVKKEKVLDSGGIFGVGGHVLAKTAINVLTESIVNWINRGFNGNPAFVDDFGGFLREIADRETAHFIEGTALELLCSPWRANIRVALSIPSGFRQEVACTLSDIVANIDNFVNGDFRQGGWGGWFQLTTRPNNNPYWLYISSASQLDSRIARQQSLDREQLAWGQGFLSKQECDPPGSQNCRTVTPGSMINSQLEKVLNTSLTQLELADEFDEIVGALMQQLVRRAFTNNRGLRSLSEGGDGQTSFTSQLGTSREVEDLDRIKEGALLDIDGYIDDETDYKNVKQATLNSVLASEVLLLNLISCYQGKIVGGLSTANEDIAQDRISTASSTIATQITPTKTSVGGDINESSQNLDILNTTKTNILNASTASEVGGLSNNISNLVLSGQLNTSDIFDAQTEQATVTAQMSSLNATTNTQITECQNFPPPPAPVIPPTT